VNPVKQPKLLILTVETPVYLVPYSDLIFIGHINTDEMKLVRIDPFAPRKQPLTRIRRHP
jgi:hypothetical protein